MGLQHLAEELGVEEGDPSLCGESSALGSMALT